MCVCSARRVPGARLSGDNHVDLLPYVDKLGLGQDRLVAKGLECAPGLSTINRFPSRA